MVPATVSLSSGVLRVKTPPPPAHSADPRPRRPPHPVHPTWDESVDPPAAGAGPVRARRRCWKRHARGVRVATVGSLLSKLDPRLHRHLAGADVIVHGAIAVGIPVGQGLVGDLGDTGQDRGPEGDDHCIGRLLFRGRAGIRPDVPS